METAELSIYIHPPPCG